MKDAKKEAAKNAAKKAKREERRVRKELKKLRKLFKKVSKYADKGREFAGDKKLVGMNQTVLTAASLAIKYIDEQLKK